MKDISHLGGGTLVGDPNTFTPDVWSKLITKYCITSVLDIGSSVGVNAKWFLDNGIDAEAIEGLPEYIEKTVLPRERMHEHDYTLGPYIPDRIFDLGLCTEFVEHVDARYVNNFLETFKKCRYLLLSHATPGQGGVHHVNEQPTEYWIKHMESIGFIHLTEDSTWMRATGPNTHYGRRTLTLFKKEYF